MEVKSTNKLLDKQFVVQIVKAPLFQLNWSLVIQQAADILTDKIFNSCVRQFFKGSTQSKKGYPIFWIEVPDPIHTQMADKLGMLEACPFPTVTFIIVVCSLNP